MDRKLAGLMLYHALGEQDILRALGQIFSRWREKSARKFQLVQEVLPQVGALVREAEFYGYAGDLWQGYLTLQLILQENPLSFSYERSQAAEGTMVRLAAGDFLCLYQLFHFDFGPLEADLGLDCFSLLRKYQAMPQAARRRRQAAGKIMALRDALAAAADAAEFARVLCDFYRRWGAGQYALFHAFRLSRQGETLSLLPLTRLAPVTFAQLLGYEEQKRELCRNTEAFLAGGPANNVLLYGDSGTGKSSSVKALLSAYAERGLRIVQVYQHEMGSLAEVIAQIRDRNYAFLLYIDDLSFEETEVGYKYLKAVIEGDIETWPENVLLYATSNRRHLIRETWKDRSDMEHDGEIHRSDTVEEKLSLSGRFGVQIHYGTPRRELYFAIVEKEARERGIALEGEELRRQADVWALRHGGVSGRAARQFIDYLGGNQEEP